MSAPIWRFRIGSHTLTFTHPGRIAVILVAVVLLILLFWKTWHRDGPPPQTSADAEIPSRVAVNDVNQTVEDRTIDRLTAAETIGAVFYRTHDTSTWHLLCRAHPQAVDGVEIIVRADELAEYHANAWKVLGYLGDARHVRLMERKLQTEFAGLLDDHHKDELGAMFDFLGLSCRRGIPEAIALVDQMQLRRYWTSVKFHLYPEQIRQRRDEAAQLQGYVMWGYALSRRDDFSKRCQAMLSDSQLTDPEVEFEALTALMSRLNRSQAEAECQPITAVQRATIRENWNGDLKNPRPVSRSTPPSRPAPTGDTERPEPQPDPVPPTLAKQLTDEAVAEFQRIRTQLKSGELDTLPQRILDNGEPLRPEMRKQLEEMFRGDVARLKLLTEHPSATAAKPSNSSVTRDPPRAGPKESFTVRYELSETAELGRRLRVDHGGFSTVAPNGNLIVLMKRMDGVWFWNPFGW